LKAIGVVFAGEHLHALCGIIRNELFFAGPTEKMTHGFEEVVCGMGR
jgi:hypothetical protein